MRGEDGENLLTCRWVDAVSFLDQGLQDNIAREVDRMRRNNTVER